MKQITRIKSNKGYTLIELVIYIALLTVLLYILTEVFIGMLKIQTESEVTSQIQQDGRFITSRLIYDIRRASSIAYPILIGSSGSELQIVVNAENYTYQQNNNKLELVNAYGTSMLNGYGTQISNLQFTRVGNMSGKPSIQIRFTLTSLIPRYEGFDQKNFQTTIALR